MQGTWIWGIARPFCSSAKGMFHHRLARTHGDFDSSGSLSRKFPESLSQECPVHLHAARNALSAISRCSTRMPPWQVYRRHCPKEQYNWNAFRTFQIKQQGRNGSTWHEATTTKENDIVTTRMERRNGKFGQGIVCSKHGSCGLSCDDGNCRCYLFNLGEFKYLYCKDNPQKALRDLQQGRKDLFASISAARSE